MSTSAGRVLVLPKGNYNASTTYNMLDCVYYNGRSYLCKQTSTGNVPTNTTYWQPMTADSSAEIQALTNQVNGNWGTGGVNLFNKNDVLDATYIDTSTGNLSTTGGTGWITTKPIPLNDNTKVTYSGNSVDAVNAVRYRILQNDTVVSFNGLRANTDTITITQGNYIQFSLRADTQNTFQIEYGSASTPYQPYAKTNLELTDDMAEITSGSYLVKRGKLVQLAINTWAAKSSITIPAGFRPKKQMIFVIEQRKESAPTEIVFNRLTVGVDGTITLLGENDQLLGTVYWFTA